MTASLPSPRKEEVAGSFGAVRSPALIYFSALDPDNSDSIVSSGDRLTVAFDIPTDRGGVPRAFWPGVANPDNRVDRAEIERLFAFSAPLGEEYSGLWTDASPLQITVVNATFAEAVPLSTTVALRDTLGGVVRNSFGNSVAAAGSAPPGACFASAARLFDVVVFRRSPRLSSL